MGDISNTTGGGWIAVGVVRSDDDRGDNKGTEWGRMQGLRVSIFDVETDFLLTLGSFSVKHALDPEGKLGSWWSSCTTAECPHVNGRETVTDLVPIEGRLPLLRAVANIEGGSGMTAHSP